MYGLPVMLSISTQTTGKTINKILQIDATVNYVMTLSFGVGRTDK